MTTTAIPGGFTISSDPQFLDLDVIHGFLASSYWAKGIPRDVVAQSILHTPLCFGVYEGEPDCENGRQVGFARVITDRATFAYLTDVFVLPPFRGRGLSKALLSVISSHPDLQNLRRFLLLTRDAHSLYGQFGFAPLTHGERFMEIASGPAIYQ